MSSVIPRELCVIFRDRIEVLSGESVQKEEVGAKAYGLAAIPSVWTLPFFVISSEMYEMYTLHHDIDIIQKNWSVGIAEALQVKGFNLSQDIYLRSNMCTESLEDRGQFESHICSVDSLFGTIKMYFDSLKDLDCAKTGVPLLIQQFVQPLGQGHISNERRLSKEARDWRGEITQNSWDGTSVASDNIFSIHLRNWRRKVVVDNANATPLKCSSLDNISQVLESPCAWATNQSLRIHFEWIFDGWRLYIVQADQEQDYGTIPTTLNYLHPSKKETFIPQSLQLLSPDDEDRYLTYSKVCNPLIYSKLGLKTAPIYILDKRDEIHQLIQGSASEGLSNDLDFLTRSPLVIRMDVDTDEQSARQMLPRTDNVRTKDEAIEWLVSNSQKLYEKYEGKLSFIFMLHNFIPAFSSAFAYAEPSNRNVLIESLWGVPEGLYYYTHDKYVADTKQQNLQKVNSSEISIIEKKIYPKNNFIYPREYGRWVCEPVHPDYIWKPAIPRESWLKEISLNTRKISEHVGAGVSVMWFVGVDSNVYGCNVFPWHHEQFTYDFVPKQTNRKKHKNEVSFTISRGTDVERLQRIADSGNRENIRYLAFKPIEENMIRNKELIENVGKIATELGAVIILEGGILSHAYYQLRRTGASVEVSNAFDSTVLNVEHDKLVRDKIPTKIESGGEVVSTKKLSDDELFEQLRVKLVEEAFEVLDARGVDDLIQELADVLEVIESIIDKKEIRRDAVNEAKIRKKEKVGGFEDGIVLQTTALPVYKAASTADETLTKRARRVFWGDKKEKTDYSEAIRRFKVPVSLKRWSTQLTAKGVGKRPDIHITLTGKRVNSNLQINISISEEFEQLTLSEDVWG